MFSNLQILVDLKKKGSRLKSFLRFANVHTLRLRFSQPALMQRVFSEFWKNKLVLLCISTNVIKVKSQAAYVKLCSLFQI